MARAAGHTPPALLSPPPRPGPSRPATRPPASKRLLCGTPRPPPAPLLEGAENARPGTSPGPFSAPGRDVPRKKAGTISGRTRDPRGSARVPVAASARSSTRRCYVTVALGARRW